MSGHPIDDARETAQELIALNQRIREENDELRRTLDAARTAEAQAREAVLKAGTDERFAAVYAWLDKNKDAVMKDLVDANGALEQENNKLKLDCATLGGEIGTLVAREATLIELLKGAAHTVNAALEQPGAEHRRVYRERLIERIDAALANAGSDAKALLDVVEAAEKFVTRTSEIADGHPAYDFIVMGIPLAKALARRSAVRRGEKTA